MLTGPIFRYELTAAGRRRRYFLVRVAYCVILLLVMWMTYEQRREYQQWQSGGRVSIRSSAAVARAVFESYSWVQLLAVMAITPALATGTIATERERRTIEYLFVTDLSNAEIVVGKVASRLLLAGQLFLAGLPMLLLFRLLGGIPVQSLAASFLLAASTALLLTALATCISVWSKRSRDAAMRVYLVMIAVLFVPTLVFGLFGALGMANSPAAAAVMWLARLNPVMTLAEAVTLGGVDLDMAEVWRVVGWHAALAIALTGVAVAAVRRVHLREIVRTAAVGTRAKLQTAAGRLTWRPPLGKRPMLWKEAFAGVAKTRLGIAGAAAAAIIAVAVIGFTIFALVEAGSRRATFRSGAASMYAEYLAGLSGLLGTGLLLLAASRAAGLVTSEKERDCWLSLMATPLSGAEVIYGKLLGNLWALKWGLFLLAGAWFAGVLFDLGVLVAAVIALGTLLDLAAFVTVLGLWFSLRSATTLRATGATLAVAVITGGGYLFCCCAIAVNSGGGDEMMLGLAPCMPFLLFCPAMFYRDSVTDFGYSSVEAEMTTAYFLGVLGYAVATIGLLNVLINDFERLAGRNTGRPDEPTDIPRTEAAGQSAPG